jgi:tetratricopeptide (TPR) repeat protein
MKRFVLLCAFLACSAVAAPVIHLTSDERIALYEKQLKASPNDLNIEAELASSFIQKLRETTDFQYLNRAAALVDRMLAVDPRNYDGIRLSVEIETHRHQFPKAAELARTLITRNPSDAGAWGLLGDSLMEMGQYDAADKAYQHMLALGPNLASYNRIAWHRFVTGQGADALSWMSMAVQAGSPVNENLAWCLVEFGDMLFKSGHTADAHAEYSKSLETLPGYHRALAALGREYAAAGEYNKAIENFKKAQAVIPLPDYAHALATLYDKLGRAAEANQQRKLIDVIDKLGQANGEKGNRMLAMNFADENRNLDRALQLAQAELETRKDVYTYDALSWVLFRGGHQQEAEEASAKSLAMHTPEPMFLYHAGIIAIAGDRADQGRELLNQALALNPSFAWPQAEDARMRLASASRATISQLVIH